MQVKQGTGSLVVACVRQQDVSAFMERMTSLGYLNLSQVEKRDILAYYAVTPVLKPVVKGAPKAESLASSVVLQSTVSLQ